MVKTDMNKIQAQPSKQMKPSTSPTQSSCKKNKYKGVRMRSWGSWVSEIRAPNQKTRIWLGSYSTAEAAARAYDAALFCLKGPSANFNFPIKSSHYIPDTLSSDPKSIQRMAAAAAAENSFIDHVPAVSAAVSSPSMSSSPSDHDDDDYMSLIQSLVANDEPVSLMEPWYSSFDSSLQYSPSMINDLYEEEDDDIRLWSFC